MTRTVLVTAAALAAAVLGVGLGRARVAASAGPGAGAGAPPGSVAPASLGAQRRWAAMLQTRLEQPGEAQPGADGVTEVTGDWVATVSAASAGQYEVSYELEHPRVRGPAGAIAETSAVAALERELGRRIWTTYTIDGAATRMHFPGDMREDVRNLLELLVTETQLVRAGRSAGGPATATSTASPDQWTATERDGGGTYFALYQRTSPSEIVKRKLRYLALDGASGGAGGLGLAVDASELRFAVDAQGAIAELHGHERSHLDAGIGGPGLRVDIGVTLTAARSGVARALVGSRERAGAEIVTRPVITERLPDEELLARMDERAIEGVTLRDLLVRVSKGQADAKTRSELEADLRRRPADVEPALAFARAGDFGDASATVLDALGAAGTAPAQAGLSALAGDRAIDPRRRTAAMTALVRTREPTEATVDTFLRLMDEVRDVRAERQVFWTAGTLAHRSEQAHPERAGRLVSAIVERYGACQGEACVVLLNALGNAGSVRVLPTVEDALRAPGADVRAAAVDALRLVRDPAADRLIADRIAGDERPSVRAAAIGTVRYRPVGSLLEPIARAITADPSEAVRAQAIQVMTEHVDESRLVFEALVQAATTDVEPGIRRLAREVLGRRWQGAVDGGGG